MGSKKEEKVFLHSIDPYKKKGIAFLKNHYVYTAVLCILAWAVNCIPMENAFSNDKVLFSLMLLGTFCFVAIFAIYENKSNSDEAVTLLILTGAFCVRLIYVWCTYYNINPHDLGSISQTPELHDGHLGYIGYIYHNGRIPDVDPVSVWAYYNAPLFYIVGAAWLKLNTLLSIEWSLALENLQFLPLLFTMWATVGMDRLLRAFDVEGSVHHALFAFFAFFPAWIWFSGMINADAMTLCWMVHILYYTVCWHKQHDIRHIILLALCFGLGMMSKINVGVLSVGTGMVFLWALIQAIRSDRGQAFQYIRQFTIFGIICIPLGLYWPLRCFVRFGMPLLYVPDTGAMWMYFGDKPFWEVFGIPSAAHLDHTKVLFDLEKDTNVWMILIRNALFDEGTAMDFPSVPAEFAGRVLIYLQIPLILFMNGCCAAVLAGKKYKVDLPLKAFIGIAYLMLLVSYVSFVWKLPYICSANFRYIAVALAIVCLGTAIFFRNRTKTLLFKGFCLYLAVSGILGVVLYLRFCFTLGMA